MVVEKNVGITERFCTTTIEPIFIYAGTADLETFTEIRGLLENPLYQDQRQKSLVGLSCGMIDVPIAGLILALNKLPYCFTLQCCYGHFIYKGQTDSHNMAPLPITDTITRVEYRIAYICLCIENSDSGRGLLEDLSEITAIDPENIQFCCAEWFWERQINSYALQVQPDRFKHKDRAKLDYREALHIQKIRNAFFDQLQELIHRRSVLKVESSEITALRALKKHLNAERAGINDQIGIYPHPIPACDLQFNYLLDERAKISRELNHVNAMLVKWSSGGIEFKDIEQLIKSSSHIDDEMADRLRSGFKRSNG